MTPSPSEQGSTVGRGRILFAEDHEDVRRVTTLLLSYEGYIVDEAENGAVALELFRANPAVYDVVITDHDMPQMDGVDLVRELRAAKFQGGVIVISGGLTQLNTAAYLDLEVDHILAKPVSFGALLQFIEESARLKRQAGDGNSRLRERFAA